MSDIEIQIRGEGAAQAAKELHSLFSGLFSEIPEPNHTVISRIKESATKTELDPVAVSALVLAIPGAIVATLDLVQRLSLPKQLGAVKDKLSASTEKHQQRIVKVNGRQYDFDKLSNEELAELILSVGDN